MSGPRQHVLLIREPLASGDFRPVIDRTYPFDDIIGAYRHVASKQKLGTVVITLKDAEDPPSSKRADSEPARDGSRRVGRASALAPGRCR